MNFASRAMKIMRRRLRKRPAAKAARREPAPYYKAAGPLAREVLRNQIRARGGRGFGGSKSMRRDRSRMLEKMHPGDCTAPLVAAAARGDHPMTARQKRQRSKYVRVALRHLKRDALAWARVATVAGVPLTGGDSHA